MRRYHDEIMARLKDVLVQKPTKPSNLSQRDNSAFRWLRNELYYEYKHGSRYKINLTGEFIQVSDEITIFPGYVFVIGDHRNQNVDSHS